MDISLSLESAIEQAAAIQDEFKQPNNEEVSKLNRKLHQEISVQSVFDVTIYSVPNCIHSSNREYSRCI